MKNNNSLTIQKTVYFEVNFLRLNIVEVPLYIRCCNANVKCKF